MTQEVLMSHADMISRYQELRVVGRELNGQLTHSLSKRIMMEGGRRLGIAKGNTFVFDTEDETSILVDYCLHDLRHDGQNAVDRYLGLRSHELTSEQASYLHSLANACYSIFVITDNESGVGVNVRDLIFKRDYFIVDIGFSNTAHPDFILASRIFTHEGITMTTGAALPVPPSFIPDLIQKATSDRPLNSRLSFKATATIIRELLANGASNKVAYHDAEKNLQLASTSTNIGNHEGRH
jgi:hypothetical protein